MKFGEVDFKDFKKFEKNLLKLADNQVDEFTEKATKELAARLLAKVIPLTPVGEYGTDKGMKGGTLRRGWVSQTHAEAESSSGDPSSSEIAAYVEGVEVRKSEKQVEIEITNPVEYALFVEFGHRTRLGTGKSPPKPNGKSWVEGSFMLTLSVRELENEAPKILEKKLEQFLKGALA